MVERPLLSVSIACFLLTSFLTNHSFAISDDLNSLSEIPMVLTPARLKQARIDSPAAVTVIDRELIDASGFRDIHELLRFVPGMSVGSRDGWNHVAVYHGTNFRDNRRMKVLVDGRSVYQPGIGTVDWSDLAITTNDIERIEVTRGPNAAAYGANAFLGVVNIITRHPLDDLGLKASINSSIGESNYGVEDYFVSYSGKSNNSAFRISAASLHDDGFNAVVEGSEKRDSKNASHINANIILNPSKDISISIRAGGKKGVNLDANADEDFVLGPTDHDVSSRFIQSEINISFNEKIETKILANYTQTESETEFFGTVPAITLTPELTALYQANAFYVNEILSGNFFPTGGTNEDDALLAAVQLRGQQLAVTNPDNVIGTVNEDIKQVRYDFEIQNTLVLNDYDKVVFGIDIRQDIVDSQTFFGGKADRDSYRLFTTWLKSWGEYFQTNIGGMFEHEESIGEDFSPRFTAIYKPKPNLALRYIFSKATRKPDLREKEGRWVYTASNIQAPISGSITEADFFLQNSADGLVESEEIISRELGLYHYLSSKKMHIDIKIFRDSLKKLINNTVSLNEFNPSNTAKLTLTGFETELDLRINNRLRFRNTYAYIDSETNSLSEETFTYKHSLTALARYEINSDSWVSLSYYLNRRIKRDMFKRLDLKASKSFHIANAKTEITGLIRRRLDNNANLFESNRYKNNTLYQLGISIAL